VCILVVMKLPAPLSAVLAWMRAHLRTSIVVGVLALALLYFAGQTFFGGKPVETLVVTPGEFVVRVADSGKVIPADEVSMAFEDTGRVADIYVDVGDEVSAGAPLIALDSGTLSADLASAEAQVAVRRVEIENRDVTLEKVRKEQDTLVANASRTLRSEGLVAVPSSSTSDQEPPVVSGIYESEQTGTYKVMVERAYAGSEDFEIRVFDLERAEPVVLPEDEPAPLGTRGLYISFPDGPAAYDGTVWFVSVPNIKSASYLANYNAYQEALRARDSAISEAEAELSERSVGQTIARAELAKAEAEVARIRSELSRRVLRAPFAGVVTAVDVEKGGAVSLSDIAVSLISADDLEIESFIPEINISGLAIGDPVSVTLDAYGDAMQFPAHVASIDPAETIRDGLSTYRVKIHFDTKDERVRSGMTANLVITTDARQGVIAIPQGLIAEENSRKFVTVLSGGKRETRTVTTGAVSSLGTIEILSGLSAGDIVVVNR
jgi:HlyD family secretion protein